MDHLGSISGVSREEQRIFDLRFLIYELWLVKVDPDSNREKWKAVPKSRELSVICCHEVSGVTPKSRKSSVICYRLSVARSLGNYVLSVVVGLLLNVSKINNKLIELLVMIIICMDIIEFSTPFFVILLQILTSLNSFMCYCILNKMKMKNIKELLKERIKKKPLLPPHETYMYRC